MLSQHILAVAKATRGSTADTGGLRRMIETGISDPELRTSALEALAALGPRSAVSRLTLIIDQRPGEPDILSPVRFDPLRVTTLDDRELLVADAPLDGWTTATLEAALSELPFDAFGCDAYLGTCWIGSSEV